MTAKKERGTQMFKVTISKGGKGICELTIPSRGDARSVARVFGAAGYDVKVIQEARVVEKEITFKSEPRKPAKKSK